MEYSFIEYFIVEIFMYPSVRYTSQSDTASRVRHPKDHILKSHAIDSPARMS